MQNRLRKSGMGLGSALTMAGGISTSRYWTKQLSALFDARSGLTITDSKGGEQITVKQFPVANFYNAVGHYSGYAETAPITTSGDYTVLIIARNEKSDTVASGLILQYINGADKGGTLSLKSGPLYDAGTIIVSKANLNIVICI